MRFEANQHNKTVYTVDVGTVYDAMDDGEKQHMVNKIWKRDRIAAQKVLATIDKQDDAIADLSQKLQESRNERGDLYMSGYRQGELDGKARALREYTQPKVDEAYQRGQQDAQKALKDFKLQRIAQHLIIMYEFEDILRAVLDARQAEEGGKW